MAYLYRHIRLDKNEPFYIGIGGLEEFDDYKRAYLEVGRNSIWKRIANKTQYEVEIILDDLPREMIIEKEKEFIKLYGRINLKKGILANMTDGGEGSKNVIYNRSYRQIIINKNDTFGRLKINKELPCLHDKYNRKIRIFECICKCGKISNVRLANLRNGSIKSCGCYQKDKVRKIARTHGQSWKKNKTSEYICWANIKSRTYKNKKICNCWLGESGFVNFLKDMGNKPSLLYKISKINRNGIYEKNNCIWKI